MRYVTGRPIQAYRSDDITALVVYTNIGDIFKIEMVGFPVGGIVGDVHLIAVDQRNIVLQTAGGYFLRFS